MPTFHYNHISQPSRAVLTFLQLAGVEYESHEIDLLGREQKTEEFLKINKWGTVPCWQEDDGDVLVESNAILRYLADKYEATDLWPKDLIQRQRVDAALDFCGSTFRPGTLPFLAETVVAPKFFGGNEPTEERLEQLKQLHADTLAKAEKWLGEKPYFAGETLSLADLQIFSEAATNHIILKIPHDDYPNFKAWFARMLENEKVKANHDILIEKCAALDG